MDTMVDDSNENNTVRTHGHSAFDLDVIPLHFPLLGNSIVVGLFSLLHIALAGLSVGFMVLAPLFQLTGRSIPFNRDLAHSVTRFTVVVFSVSTVLAVIMVELLIGLFPVTTMWMWNRFRGPIALGVVAFILQLIMLYPYYHFWEPLQRYSLAFHIDPGSAGRGVHVGLGARCWMGWDPICSRRWRAPRHGETCGTRHGGRCCSIGWSAIS